MLFTNFIFLFVFFPLCVGGYLVLWGIQKKIGKMNLRIGDIFLILTSLVFYGWARLEGILYLCIYIFLAYIMGKMIEKKDRSVDKSKIIVGIFVLVLAGILYFYKYIDFTLQSLNDILQTDFTLFYVFVPLGISFITFSAISYVVDIYRGNSTAGSLLDVALYITFFPKVVSGPIVLWKDFQAQMHNRTMNDVRFMYALNRIMIGYAKKVFLADSFGLMVSDIQQNMMVGMDVPTAWWCALLYMLQIYYDFAGYSDIALGLGELFGFQFKENFHFPYVSASITEFWRRWHISLGTWFREYIYIPLGGNRKGKIRTLGNLFIVFLVTGIWHGAGWNYIFWGILNGTCMLVERCIRGKKFYVRIPYVVKWAGTMFIVLISWVIFRIPSLIEGAYFLKIMFGMKEFSSVNFTFAYYFTPKMITLVMIGILGATALHRKCFYDIYSKVNESKILFVMQEVILFGIMVLVVMFVVNSTYSPFIYFQY
ncbi:alginate O-acetyltransferase complex protein AlgI [Faecalicatena contorta]|uniref:Alginate O-acetyltransferase complex protein AlgI n=2 Tax=Faecalicatena contorta TaxID=39482 RepID=A0A315ZRQ4_9FIRM|nr:alginate O-acetyltransferase complex protein AlgI [Faecalicatena contorta]SUQ15502.1 alginate O-acetyltransferase complex protein AlgI [Faecalicatena contorta]